MRGRYYPGETNPDTDVFALAKSPEVQGQHSSFVDSDIQPVKLEKYLKTNSGNMKLKRPHLSGSSGKMTFAR